MREGGVADIPFTESVDRFVRGAAHGADIGAQLEMGQTLLVSERAYCVVGADGEVRLLAAFDADGAREVLRAALARSSHANVSWIGANQNWALEVVMDAGLELTCDAGCVFVGR